jgi:FimV-like protein
MLTHYLEIIWLTVSSHILFFVELFLAIVILISLFFFKKQKPIQPASLPKEQDTVSKVPTIITSQDIRAIAGDNVLTTQLDLARAYIEIGKKKLAKKILEHVIENGNLGQRQAAQKLMMIL